VRGALRSVRSSLWSVASDQRQQLSNLLDDHETIIRYLRREIDPFSSDLKDPGTGDFITGIMKKHEKWAWFIRSYLK